MAIAIIVLVAYKMTSCKLASVLFNTNYKMVGRRDNSRSGVVDSTFYVMLDNHLKEARDVTDTSRLNHVNEHYSLVMSRIYSAAGLEVLHEF